ncbi:MAG TPA: hydrogenase formation protein HypD [Candidatus Eisenbergiella merdipullorum]|uniref:Hydrogenase formation protein HypD n=1 Tax=Candidatus Eisenbergiella merdipullorum TaxID=2838553 RepID=A0A9D2I868_9FIRM|nr:hydrogenase formation protein HypD [Candidatus Eisenbergiella merdipullorum]
MKILEYLQSYRGKPLRFMEVCGTHTAEINRNGIPALLPPSIELVSGPGCPVCVTVSAYIDRLIELGMDPENCIVTFGDMLRVPGSSISLSEARSRGCSVRMVYSPMDALKLAKADPGHVYIFAAVGFETTTPVYALLVQEALEQGIGNLRLLTSLKVMPPVIDWICAHNSDSAQSGEACESQRIHGFLAPGHVSVITGSRAFEPLARKYGLPFVVAGFEGEEILAAIAALVKLQGQGRVLNMYPSAVTEEGNRTAQERVERIFEPCDAAWRGIGVIAGSGRKLRKEYEAFDAGSASLLEDEGGNPACCCARVLMGRIRPRECPLFGKACTPQTPQGACMVSTEGSCFSCWQSEGL